jgi:hypothetical protein
MMKRNDADHALFASAFSLGDDALLGRRQLLARGWRLFTRG